MLRRRDARDQAGIVSRRASRLSAPDFFLSYIQTPQPVSYFIACERSASARLRAATNSLVRSKAALSSDTRMGLLM